MKSALIIRESWRKYGRKYWVAGALMLALLSVVSPSFAQLSTASINGVVTDAQGAVIPRATIVLTNVATSVENTTLSNGAGHYTFLNILPGNYTLAAKATGFAPMKVSAFTLVVNQVATVNFELKVGSLNTVVTVQANQALLNVTSASLGTVVATRQVNDLPLNGRNFTQLLTLTPGASPINVGQNAQGGFGGTQPAQGSSFVLPAVNGQTGRSNFFLTDGMINYGSYMSSYAVPPIIDAIQEFKVVSHTDSAEFGSVLGGVVNVVTKSGTNQFHGSAWEFNRNTAYDARNYFLPAGVPKAPYHQNQFGFSVGGPIWIPKVYNGHNKTFFFGAYQGFRYLTNSDTPLRVPTPTQLSGNLSGWPTQIYNPFTTRPDPNHPGSYLRNPFPGNQIPSSLISQQMVDWANFVYPKAGPVFDSAGDNALDTTPLVQNQDQFMIRADQKLGANDSAFFRYSWFNSTQTASGGVPGLISGLDTPAQDWGVNYVHVFSPSLVLQAEFSRDHLVVKTPTLFTRPVSGVIAAVGFDPHFVNGFNVPGHSTLLPELGIPGYAGDAGGAPGVGAGESIDDIPPATDSNEYSGTVTKTTGRHSLTFGGGYTTMGLACLDALPVVNFAAQETGNPENSNDPGDALASFLLNVPDSAIRWNTDEHERPGGVFSVFGQDSWKALHNLTLNLGLRYDITFIPPFGTKATIGKNGGIETGDMDYSNGTYIVQWLPPTCSVRGHAPCIPGNGTLPAHVVVDPRGRISHNVYTNLGPRLGFAYQAGTKTVIRGAFGIVYDNWAAQQQTSQNIGGDWPDNGRQQEENINQPTSASPTPTTTGQNPFGDSLASLYPQPTPFNEVEYYYDPHMKNPYSEQWNVGVERQLSRSTTATLSYVGSVSKRLDVGGFYNTALTPGPGDPQSRALFPYIVASNYDRSIGSSNYNALQFVLNQRYDNGLTYQVAYTWSKNMDVAGDGWYGVEGGVPQDPYNPSAYGGYSIAGTDLTNVLTFNGLYQLQFGRGQRFSTHNKFLDYALGNWQVNTIFMARSGQPFTPGTTDDVANTGNSNEYETLDVIGDPNKISKRTPGEWFNTAAFALPPKYTYGTAARNMLRSAGYWNLDGSLFRDFPLGSESRYLELRFEGFNVFNTTVFGLPNNIIDSGVFGTVNTTANNARQLQLGAKFIF